MSLQSNNRLSRSSFQSRSKEFHREILDFELFLIRSQISAISPGTRELTQGLSLARAGLTMLVGNGADANLAKRLRTD
jgi:hypothetical protein